MRMFIDITEEQLQTWMGKKMNKWGNLITIINKTTFWLKMKNNLLREYVVEWSGQTAVPNWDFIHKAATPIVNSLTKYYQHLTF